MYSYIYYYFYLIAKKINNPDSEESSFGVLMVIQMGHYMLLIGILKQFIDLPVIQFSEVSYINKLMWLPFVATYYYFMNKFYAKRLDIYKEKYRTIRIIWQKTFGLIIFIISPFPIAILLLNRE